MCSPVKRRGPKAPPVAYSVEFKGGSSPDTICRHQSMLVVAVALAVPKIVNEPAAGTMRSTRSKVPSAAAWLITAHTLELASTAGQVTTTEDAPAAMATRPAVLVVVTAPVV